MEALPKRRGLVPPELSDQYFPMAKTSTLTVRSRPGSDDFQEVLLNGEVIGELTHDAGGWSGMEEARSILRALAERLGWKYVEKL